MYAGMKERSFALAAIFSLVLFILPAKSIAQDLAIKITYPPDNAILPHCNDINITSDIQTGSADINYVIYHSGYRTLRRIRKAPWSYLWENVPNAWVPLWAEVFDKEGNKAVSDTVYFRVGDVEKGEKIINGGFDCRLWPWKTDRQGTAEFTVNMMNDLYFDDSSYVYIDINNGGELIWYIQFIQSFALEAGHTYEIFFLAEAEDNKPISFNFQQTGGEWTVYKQFDIEVTDEIAYGPFTFECEVDDPTAYFKFLIGLNDLSIAIDAVIIIDLDATSVDKKQDEKVAIENFQLFQNWPNPFNMSTTIAYYLPQAADVSVDIFNMQGKAVCTLESGARPAGPQRLFWSGTDDHGVPLPSGVYLYRLRVQNNQQELVQYRKAVLLR